MDNLSIATYVVDAIDNYIVSTVHGYAELDLVCGLLLTHMAKLDPNRKVPELEHTLTLSEAIELMKNA